MLKTLASGILVSSILFSISAADNGFPRCDCNEEGFWSTENILVCQKVGDFLIAVAYFSIPIELLYFVSCSNVPFKWVLFQFIAFIVLCGMTHLLNGWTYGPHPFQLMVALTVFKFLTALVSIATAITLITLIPLLLKVKVREFMLKKKTWDLGREVGIIRRQKEAGWHVRMLTQEIRKFIDRPMILYTTMVELSKTLDLQNCAVWMPNEIRTEMNLTHELKGRNLPNSYNTSIPITDPCVQEIKGTDGVKILEPDSALAAASSDGPAEPGPVAAIRMPMLRVSNFKGGTPEMIPTCHAILVLVLPGGHGRFWSNQELEIVKVVADQVAVAISHATVLEESRLMMDQLVEQNRALQQAKQDAMMASQARNSFQKVMSDGMRRPMHSILGLLSLVQGENLSGEQQILVDAMCKTSNVLSTLINDVMDMPAAKDSGRFLLEMRTFRLHSLIREAACVAKCLCAYRGCSFVAEIQKSLPDHVMGDERRVFQVILHMVRNLLHGSAGGGSVTFRVHSESGSQGGNVQQWAAWRTSSSSSDGHVDVKFEIGINNSNSQLEHPMPGVQFVRRKNSHSKEGVEEALSFSVCKKLVQLMRGNIWVVPKPDGFDQSMALVLRFQLSPSIVIGISEVGDSASAEYPHSNSLFKGLRVLLADEDDVNRAVTRKLLQKLGCAVSTVASGHECLSALAPACTSFQVVLLDLSLPGLDGFEVSMRIRKFRSHSWPLLIALTASSDVDVWERCIQIGMNGVIRKPAMLQGIADELRKVLLQANKVM
ncbi:ethylene receptor 2-like [Diospyros lotus]|uniref:ethylene receptor 2-like n=1 Tax=Diospyros lotus TaxID=55363 RepID=UPI002255C9E3|nr:ethylene receptor 2-like [Diospyros lotus]XP_052190751.1 ethylene receptor 2-like [Diospyros lotus]XP_052190752.1 ethylene receptor 2-like [Diospyros lotus]